ncbi:DNA-directed RNA polymerase subunit beta [endosymbiont of Pachyrhynchus infernalis]|uniref:DNA-directed RNA polymerase subunit beta n=1 Tax=endosymbiont of Pachyrhynchus infernalis TaxID=1971488 RepID=UPI000DC70F44|nr:DNA-directed RNA polymerase subunit beta [endosymbiont of Pachyrhynchus infernalis]BBA84826.1 DNA-directed RNA polymerase subunit beta [endosymbiont of Pachyrhynchus infernalis]
MSNLNNRIRKDFSKFNNILNIPNLLSIQRESYDKFIGINNKLDSGISNIFNFIFPISSYDNNTVLKYNDFYIENSIYDIQECINRNITYSFSLKSKLSLFINNSLIKEQDTYISYIPIMTENCSFIINGIEKVIVSQLHRSPGVFFDIDKEKSNIYNKNIYNAKIIPYRGSWIDFEFDYKDNLFMRIDKKKKFPVTLILHAFECSNEEILNFFFEKTILDINNNCISINIDFNVILNSIIDFDIYKDNILYIKNGKNISNNDIELLIKNNIYKTDVDFNYIFGKILYKNYYNEHDELLLSSNTLIDKNVIEIIKKNNIKNIEILYDKYDNICISNTIRIDSTYDYNSSVIELFKILKSGESSNIESAKSLFKSIFFSNSKYDLSNIGRMKLNKSLLNNNDNNNLYITKYDIINILKKLINIKNNKDCIDDIDSLGNRRVKLVGEMIENQFKLGLIKVRKSIKEKLSLENIKSLNFQDIINSKQITSVIKEFFNLNQLSQFMDQNNPLSEITHKRRISALGPGGLTRERAGFEVRDVHNTHYGRLCPIETPEGPNIGLINSLSIYSRVNKYGFLETPYRVVNNNKITNEIHYLSAIEEYNFIIAQALTRLDKNNNFVDELIICRNKGEFKLFNKNLINYIDISPKQIVSVGSSLIPFLEHDDANRALMGANMQRQAVPTIKPDSPIIGTGMEKIVARDSGSLIIAKRGGKIIYLDYSIIIIEVNDSEIIDEKSNIDIYNLKKFIKSNQNTCINNTVIVSLNDIVNKNDVLADGSSTSLGELALGQNVRVAFMSYNGYNFEDSILISEKLVYDNKFSSIHIQELICISRDTKLGPEEITSDIPNVNDLSLSKLDESGIVYIGANISEGDILVGKITPKEETQLTPEEKLLKAIFGEKSSNVKDSSLRVPNGMFGTVIDVQIFNREGIKKDKRSISIEHTKIKNKEKDLLEEKNIIKLGIINKINHLIEYLNINLDKISINNIQINIDNIDENLSTNHNILYNLIKKFNSLEKEYNDKLDLFCLKINKKTELSPGIIKIVKIYIAIKRHIQVGDKMSGRHGNKGVVSKINPIEDMPYDSDGNIVDIVLNPLGVPSRMNIGQILEAHLGLAAKKIGENIDKLLKLENNFLKLKEYIKSVYSIGNDINQKINFDNYSYNEFLNFAKSITSGIYISTPVFDGANQNEIKNMLEISNISKSGQLVLFNGCNGEKFDRKITVGYIYMMKLNHLVDDKMHARSTGSYSLITQQPLGGKSQFGGQRFGEMEVWALEAYGAAYTLQEMLTVKSDDVNGRINMYKNIINNNYNIKFNIPESFNVLFKEIRSLGINIELCE